MSRLSHLCDVLQRFLQGEDIPNSSISARVKREGVFETLISANAIEKERKGAGYIWKMIKRETVERYLSHTCPNHKEDKSRGERYNNVRMFRNSKAKSRKSHRLIFTRSKASFTLNNERLPHTRENVVGSQLISLQASKICFVENLENFMNNKHLVDDGWVLVYPVGRIGKQLLERIEADEVMHFGDLDYVGLNEFTRIKSILPQALLYIPENYFEDARRMGEEIKSSQKASPRLLVLAKSDPQVRELLDFLHRENLYLEQEGYADE